jgi:hypothetical protein
LYQPPLGVAFLWPNPLIFKTLTALGKITLNAKLAIQATLSTAIVAFACYNLVLGQNKEWAGTTIATILGLWFDAPTVVRRDSDREGE